MTHIPQSILFDAFAVGMSLQNNPTLANDRLAQETLRRVVQSVTAELEAGHALREQILLAYDQIETHGRVADHIGGDITSLVDHCTHQMRGTPRRDIDG